MGKMVQVASITMSTTEIVITISLIQYNIVVFGSILKFLLFLLLYL
jgi:hypothetical protein